MPSLRTRVVERFCERKQLTVDTRVPREPENALQLSTVNATGRARSLTWAWMEDAVQEGT